MAFGLMLTGLAAGPMATVAHATGPDALSFCGSATAINATQGGVTTIINTTGTLPTTGGYLSKFMRQANVPGLVSAQTLRAIARAQDSLSVTQASVQNLNLTVGGNTITAASVGSKAVARCADAGPITIGTTEITNLVINGNPVVVTGAANQTVALPNGGRVIINEQIRVSPSEIIVNALRITIPGDPASNIVIGSSYACVTCPNSSKNVCPHTQGFWKNHPEVWKPVVLHLGNQSYTKAELLTLFNTPPKGDASLILAHQLIAARLSISSGSNTSILTTISVADNLLSNFAGKLPYKVSTTSTVGQAMVNAAAILDQYNNTQTNCKR